MPLPSVLVLLATHNSLKEPCFAKLYTFAHTVPLAFMSFPSEILPCPIMPDTHHLHEDFSDPLKQRQSLSPLAHYCTELMLRGKQYDLVKARLPWIPASPLIRWYLQNCLICLYYSFLIWKMIKNNSKYFIRLLETLLRQLFMLYMWSTYNRTCLSKHEIKVINYYIV